MGLGGSQNTLIGLDSISWDTRGLERILEQANLDFFQDCLPGSKQGCSEFTGLGIAGPVQAWPGFVGPTVFFHNFDYTEVTLAHAQLGLAGCNWIKWTQFGLAAFSKAGLLLVQALAVGRLGLERRLELPEPMQAYLSFALSRYVWVLLSFVDLA